MLSRLVSRLLILILLLTVFSPGFGWEAAGGMAAHKHSAAQAGEHVHDDGHNHAAPASNAGQVESAPGGCDEAQHHCCPGHVLGHLPAGLTAGPQLLVPGGSDARIEASARSFSSRIPDGLERPPRVAA